MAPDVEEPNFPVQLEPENPPPFSEMQIRLLLLVWLEVLGLVYSRELPPPPEDDVGVRWGLASDSLEYIMRTIVEMASVVHVRVIPSRFRVSFIENGRVFVTWRFVQIREAH